METKHTPGPWLRDERTVYALETVRGHLGRMETRNRFSFGVQGPHAPPAELEAVATLAQAAPDLLEALERIRDLDPDAQTRDIAEAAIARARGEG